MRYSVATKCISCDSETLKRVFYLKSLPLADKLNYQKGEDFESAPISLVQCANCKLAFVTELIEPSILFPPEYPYFTGVSSVLKQHFYELGISLIDRFGLSRNSFVLDIGSNDGTALLPFKENSVEVLGIDPTTWPSLRALRKGIPTLREFWSFETSDIVRSELDRSIDLILCNNVISHVDDPKEFIRGLENVSDENTIIVAEFPYLKSILDNTAFDIVFHQHVSYFTLSSFDSLIRQHGFHLNDAEILKVHGGNLRVYFSRKSGQTEQLRRLVSTEVKSDVNTLELLQSFVSRINQVKSNTIQLIDELIDKGNTIMGYGAAGKATMLIEYFNLNRERLNGLIDKNPVKQGRYFPAHDHLIHAPDLLHDPAQRPDYLVILAWTLKGEIIKELEFFRKEGGKFIIILPELEVI